MHKTTYHYEHIWSDSIGELVAIANERAAQGFRLVHVVSRSSHDPLYYWQGIVETVDRQVTPVPDLSELNDDA